MSEAASPPPALRRFWRVGAGTQDVSVESGAPAPGRVVSFAPGDALRPPWLPAGEAVPLWFERVLPEAAGGDATLAEFVEDGVRRPAVVERAGGVAFRFDPNEVIASILDEAHVAPRRPLHTRVPLPYQWVPGELRLRVFRWLARGDDEGRGFPAWPIDRSVDTLRWVYRRALERGGAAGVSDGFWPEGKRYAFAVSHDVDTAAGLARVDDVADFEAELELRSTWFIVGDLLERSPAPAERLRERGHEIGLHGDRHDNRLAYLARETTERRLAACRESVRRFDIKGFRAPSLLESRPLRQALREAFDYASQVPDSEVASLIAPRRGCSTAFPFTREGLLEIPITLPLDDKLVLAGLDEPGVLESWRAKLAWAREVRGVAQLVVHNEPHLLRRCRGAYEALLREVAADTSAWHATLGAISTWWKESGRT